MLKHLTFLSLLFLCLAGLVYPNQTAEPETPSYILMNYQIQESVRVVKQTREAEEKAAKQKAIDNLISYLENKWKRPRNDIREAVELSFMLANMAPKMASSRSYTPSSTQLADYKGWPRPIDILAIMQVESKFDKKAQDSASGSTGLMQINASVHPIDPAALRAPSTNLTWAIALLRTYRAMVKSDSQALVAYNQGPGSVAATCGNNRTCQTEYTQKVALAKQELQRHYHL